MLVPGKRLGGQEDEFQSRPCKGGKVDSVFLRPSVYLKLRTSSFCTPCLE